MPTRFLPIAMSNAEVTLPDYVSKSLKTLILSCRWSVSGLDVVLDDCDCLPVPLRSSHVRNLIGKISQPDRSRPSMPYIQTQNSAA